MPFEARLLRVQLPFGLPPVIAGQKAFQACRPGTCGRWTCGNPYTKRWFIQIGEGDDLPVDADDLGLLREQLEAQLREVEIAEEALTRPRQE